MPSSPSAPSGLRSLGEHLCASFPITPSRTYGNAALKEGRVHLDLLAGRENARGTVGGNAATTITDGSVQLNVAAGSLDEDTAIAFFAYDTFSSFLPSTNGITPLGEVTIDLGSSTLNTSASLTFHNVATAPGDTLVVARVDRAEFDGIPRLQVVALADVVTANGETSAVSRVDTGLPGLALDGIKAEGRYVLLRLAGPVGWLKGLTTAGGSPVRALVSTNTLPFFATSSGSGAFAIPSAPGAVTLTARVLGQSLVGSASAVAIDGVPVTADIALQGTVSQATVVPVSGSLGVEVNEPLTLTSPVALNPNTVIPANISLRRVPPQRCAEPDPPASLNCAATQIPLRLVLSGSGKQLSIVPTAPVTIPATPALEFSTDYRLEVTGLLDTVGGLVTAPTINFRTKDDVKPVYNLKALTFSFPDADGLVTVSAPNGTFPPGTEILIINSGNGVVVGLTAGNDGQVSGAIPAGISDTLFVSVTDPFGNTTSFESSKFFDPATGQTAIGPGGGTIEGPLGTAIQIPEGALSEGVAFKLDVLSPEQYDTQFPNERPAFGTRPIGTVLKISAAQPGTFHRPVKLTFNVPANFASTHPGADPRDAVFYALKRSTLPGGALGFEVVDHAFAVCPGDAPGGDLPPRNDPQKPTCGVSDLTVKTASPPHPEFTGQFLADIYIILTYDWSSAGARTALAGTVVGRVRRQAWGGGDQAGQVRYEPVQGAVVFGSDAQGNPLQSAKSLFAISQQDGTYTLWDDAYQGGAVTVHAFSDGVTATGTGFEGNPQDVSASWGPFPALRFYQNKAHVDVLFEAQAPPPPAPDVDVVVMRESDRVDTRGLSTVGTPLRIGFRNNRKNESVTIGSLDINGENLTVSLDPGGIFAGITQDVWTPSQSGTYVLKTTALAPIGGSIPVSTTVRIVAAGGGVDTDQTQPPRVLDQRTYPKRGARNVQTAIFPTIAFSEPVVGVTYSTVQFTRSDSSAQGPVPPPATSEAFKITGVTAAGQVIDDVTTAPTLPITAITIRPLYGLKYRQHYTLSLTDGIQDLDAAGGTPSPKALVPYTTTFDTFGPESIPPDGEPVSTTTTGFYVAKNAEGDAVSMWSLKHQIAGSNWFGLLTGYDVTDPINVVETTSLAILGRPMDLVGEGSIVAVATAPGVKSLPSNVRLYDVSDPANPSWVGAASLTKAISEGTVNRITLRGNRVYAGTYRKGIQILDVESMRSALEPCCGVGYFKAVSDLNLDQKGFNEEALIASIPVSGPSGQQSFFTGIKSIPQSAEPLIVATGNFGLALARESSPGGTVYRGTPSKDGETLQYGLALDVATVEGYDIAVVAAISGPKQVLMMVDVTNPLLPVVRSVREIVADGAVVDVLVNGTLAYVSTQKATTPASLGVEVFDISDLSTVAYLGRIDGVGGRLSLVGKLLYGATSGTFGAPIEGLGGVRSAALGSFALIEGTNPPVVVVGEGPRAAEDFTLKYRVIPASLEVESAQIEYRYADATVGAPVNVALNSQGRGELPLGFGFTFPAVGQEVARPRLTLKTTAGEDVVGPLRSWRIEQPTVELVFDDDQEEAVTADKPEVGVEVASAEWARRAELAAEKGEPAPSPKAVRFEAILAPATVSPAVALSSGGFFETKLLTSTQPHQSRSVLAKIGDVVLGESEGVEVEPGEAAQATSTLTVEDSKKAIPADDLSQTILTLVAKDQYGNPVADGTAVVWEKGDGADGDFVEAQEGTSGGQATVKYRAGVNPGTVTVNAHVDDALLTVSIQQAPLGVVLVAPTTRSFFNKTALPLELRVTSPAGPVANGAKIGWFATAGRVTETQPVTDGIARANWDPTQTTWRPRVDFVAIVGQGRAQQRMSWTRTAVVAGNAQRSGVRTASLNPGAVGSPLIIQGATEPRHVAVSPAVVAGDIQGDQEVPFEKADGTTEMVAVKATATYQVFGLTPGESVTVRLGTNRNPNVAPIVHFTGDEKEGTTIPDATGMHNGEAPAGVTLTQAGYKGGAFTLAASGFNPTETGGITIDDDPEFAFGGAFMVQAAVRPPPAGSGFESGSAGAGTLIKKGDAFALELVEVSGELRARFTIKTPTGPNFITSSLPVPRSEWSLVTGKYDNGRIYVGVENALESMFVSGEPVLVVAPIQIGPGLTGDLDEIRIFDLTKGALSTFGNGQQTLNFAADASGEFSSPIVATGALSAPRVAAYYRNLGVRMASARLNELSFTLPSEFQQDPGTVAESGIAIATIEAETEWNDAAESATTRVDFVTAKTMAFFAKLGHAIVIGSGGAGDPPDLALVAGDLVGSFFVAPVTIVRDVANSMDRLIRGAANGQDGLDLALGLVNVGASLVKGKAGALLKIGTLAKKLPTGSRSAKVVARLMAAEAALAAGASGVSRIKKVVEVANYSATAATLVGGILDGIGDDGEAVANLDTVLTNAEPVPGDPIAAVGEIERLRRDPDTTPAGGRMVLAGLATPFDEGAPAADVPGLVKKYLRFSKKRAEGAEAAYKALKTKGVGSPFSIIRRITKSKLDDNPKLAEEMLDGLSELSRKALNAEAMPAMARRLGSARGLTKSAQQFVMKAMRTKVGGAEKIGVEVFERIEVAGGKNVRRFYDFVVQQGTNLIRYEVKNWKLSSFTPFPPRAGSDAYKAWRTARVQFMRDMINLGSTPGQVKWVFPKSFLDAHKTALAKEFMDSINSTKFRQVIGKAGSERYEAIIRGLGGAIDPRTGKGTVPIGKILEMLESLQ